MITLSRIYEILKDPIYTGFFYYGGERYELDERLPRLITEDEHRKVLMLLSKRHIPRIQHHETTFAGFLQAADGNFIGQDVKYQLICDCKHKFAYRKKDQCPQCGVDIAGLDSPKYLNFTYYYNVKRKKAGQEYKSISEESVASELIKFVEENLTFSRDLSEWSKKYITELRDREINENVFWEQKHQSDMVEYEAKKSRLREMLRDQQITDLEYRADLVVLNERYASVDMKRKHVDWFARMNEIVDLTQCALDVLKKGSVQAKRNLLSKLGSNLTWDDKTLSISNSKAVNKLVEGMKRAREINQKFEPKNTFVNQSLNKKTDRFQPVFSTLLRG